MPPDWKPPAPPKPPPPMPPPPPPPPPRANAIVGETRPMDATANNAITVLFNITILRQRYITPNHDTLRRWSSLRGNAIGFDITVAQLCARDA